MAEQISRNCRLGDIKTELQQFTVNAWCAPERVRAVHLANERPQLTAQRCSGVHMVRSYANQGPNKELHLLIRLSYSDRLLALRSAKFMHR